MGYIVEPDPHKVADAILKFYNENKEQEFVQHILIEKEKYSWKKMVQNIKLLSNPK